jgi:hypothetical protein
MCSLVELHGESIKICVKTNIKNRKYGEIMKAKIETANIPQATIRKKFVGLILSLVSFGIALKTMDEVFERAIDKWTNCYQWPVLFNATYQAWYTVQGCMNLWGAEIICFVWIGLSTVAAVTFAYLLGREGNISVARKN